MIGVGVGVGINAGSPQVVAGNYTFTNAEASAVAARMTTPPSNARKALIDNLVGSLKNGATSATNIWAKMDFLWVLAAADSQASRLDWTAAHHDLSIAGTPTFTADRGWNSDGTSNGNILTSTYNPSVGPLWTQGSAHLGAFGLTAGTNGIVSAGTDGGNTFVRANNGIGPGTISLNVSGLQAVTAPAGFPPAHICGSRIAVASATGYRNGVAGTADTTHSAAVPGSANMCVLSNGVANTSTEGLVALVHGGSSLNAAEVLDTYNAFQTYLHAIGAV